jgi:hypothetical protein
VVKKLQMENVPSHYLTTLHTKSLLKNKQHFLPQRWEGMLLWNCVVYMPPIPKHINLNTFTAG